MVKTLKKLIFVVSAGLFVLTVGIVVPAGGVTADVNLTIRPAHNIPPDRITNLTSLKAVYVAGGVDGRVELSWTAPQTENNIQIKDYYIKYDTQSVNDAPFLGNTTLWWEQTSGTEIGEINLYDWWSNPGDEINYTKDGLVPQVTYYFAIKARDEFDNLSDIDLKTFNNNQPFAVASWDNIPPAAITNLSALTGDNAGQIKLSWIAPGDDGTIGVIADGKYRIDYATYSKSWNVNNFEKEFTTNTVIGEKHTYVVDVSSDVIYYFVIWTADEYENFSGNSNEASAKPFTALFNKPITPLTALTDNTVDGKINLAWTSVGGVSGQYILKYSTISLENMSDNTTAWWNQAKTYSEGWSPSPLPEGEEETASISDGLIPGTTYYLSIRAVTIFGSTSPVGNVAWAIAGDKIPDAPKNLTRELQLNKVKLTWDENSEPDINSYIVYRKGEDDFVIIATVTSSTLEYLDESVEYGKIYKYKLKAMDNTGNMSDFSNEVEVVVVISIEISDIDIIKVTQITSDSITFEWPEVVKSTEYIKGYSIERTDDLNKDFEEPPVGFVYSTETLRYTVPISDKVYYYTVKTVYVNNDESKGLLLIDTSEKVNLIYRSEDGNARLMVPNSFAHELYNDGLVKIRVEKEENPEFLLNYKIKAVKGNKVLKDFIFQNTRMGARVVISYRQLLGFTQKSSAFSVALTNGEQQLALFWYNGVEWVKLGGVHNELSSEIYIDSRKLGSYAIKLASLATEFTLNWVKPRIFTPEEGDWRINVVRFGFENPNYAEVTVRIFDITGAEIRIKVRREGTNVIAWDGRDESGSIVRGGIFIYQVEADGKVFNGTIVVAK